jgi:hypothetical protein
MSTVPGSELARPFHPWRLRWYAAAAGLTGVVFAGATIGVGTGALTPNRTLDVVANLLMAVPILGLPVLALRNAPGEERTPLQKAAEFSLVFLALSAASQLSYELLFVIGHPLGWWHAGGEPGWGWLWWQYAQTDARYVSADPASFGMEVTAVCSGVLLALAFKNLIDPALVIRSRIRYLWLAFLGCTAILATTVTYLVSEARTGFADVGEGWFGLVFKFLIMNGAFVVLPGLVLAALCQQIAFLERTIGATDGVGFPDLGRPERVLAPTPQKENHA